MNRDEILGIIRHALTFFGGIITTHGIADKETVGVIIGAIITVVGGVWSIYDKRTRNSDGTSIAGAVAFLLIPVLIFGGMGCKSTPATQVYKVSSAADISATTALAVWDSYLASHEVPPEKELIVKAAYDKYKAAQIAVLDAAIAFKQSGDAGRPALDSAIAAAGASLGNLIGLLRQFGVQGL